MGQILGPDKISSLTKASSTVVTLTSGSKVTIGGQQFVLSSDLSLNTATSGAGGIDTGAVAANKLYSVFVVRSSGVISLVASISSSPSGFTQYSSAIGYFDTDNSSNVLTVAKDTWGHIGDEFSGQYTEAQVQSMKGPGWILEDGRSVVGSSWATLTGRTSVPDARSVVRRGKDNGRGLNPDGDLTLGTYQGDQYASHQHAARGLAPNNQQNTSLFGTTNYSTGGQFTGDASGWWSNTDFRGGNETRMKNVTTNHFIKIN